MLLLNQNAIALISGGFNGVTIDLEFCVLDTEFSQVAWLVSQFVAGQLDANGLAQAIDNNRGNFDTIQIDCFNLNFN